MLVFSIPKWFIGAQAEGIARRSATRVDSGQGRLTGPGTPFLVTARPNHNERRRALEP